MIFWTLVYIPLIWYFEKIMPKQFGISLPFYFIFQKSYWLDDEFVYAASILKNNKLDQESGVENDTEKSAHDETHFEEEPLRIRPSVVLNRVSKVPKTFLKTKYYIFSLIKHLIASNRNLEVDSPQKLQWRI
jgi:hypothetical protein